MEWQPIESAPKDGTFVLLCGGKTTEDFYEEREEPEHILRRPVVAFWDEYYPGEGNWSYGFWDGLWRSVYDEPTHWMPLPPPPAIEQGER